MGPSGIPGRCERKLLDRRIPHGRLNSVARSPGNIQLSQGCHTNLLREKIQQVMREAGVLSGEKIRERITPVITFETQAAWWIGEIKAGRIVNSKTRKLIRPRTIDGYSTAAGAISLQWSATRLSPRLTILKRRNWSPG